MNTVARNSILDRESVKRKLRRMAFEIAERNADETGLIIAGINGNGEVLALNLLKELKSIAPLNLDYLTVELNKKSPRDA